MLIRSIENILNWRKQNKWEYLLMTRILLRKRYIDMSIGRWVRVLDEGGFKMNPELSFKLHGKKIIIKDYDICSNIFSKMRGLMFRAVDYKKPLLFVWKNKERVAIHSFFCRKFVAIWFSDLRIVDVKIVNPFKSCVIPFEKFNMLLEIPFSYLGENKNLSSVIRNI